MKKRIVRTATLSLTVLFAAALMSFAKAAQKTSPAAAKSDAKATASNPAAASDVTKPTASSPAAATTSAQPSEAEMMKQMMELAKLNENHKLLATLAGSWTYTIKMWMNPDPKAPPMNSTGSGVRKAMMDGRYFVFDVSGQMKMPGADGKMKDMQFKGMGLEGYDNVKKKFVGSWIDNMGTGIYLMEGTYDAATKTFTYNAEMEMMPGMKTKVREVLKIVDADHHTFEWYEDRGGQEAKTMEINYTRKK